MLPATDLRCRTDAFFLKAGWKSLGVSFDAIPIITALSDGWTIGECRSASVKRRRVTAAAICSLTFGQDGKADMDAEGGG